MGSVLLAVVLLGCDARTDIQASDANNAHEKIWVFVQINVPEEDGGVESYYYYGQIPQKTYDGISQNVFDKGFILLENVKYWGNDDLLHEYKDDENTGDLVYRIEDIRRIKRVHTVPDVGVASGSLSPPPADEDVAACAGDACHEQPDAAPAVVPSE
ncbi:MAG TPA: hypothetical protein VIM96_08345 [Pseudomonadales bacterium]|jgi:hypothetical protein